MEVSGYFTNIKDPEALH